MGVPNPQAEAISKTLAALDNLETILSIFNRVIPTLSVSDEKAVDDNFEEYRNNIQKAKENLKQL